MNRLEQEILTYTTAEEIAKDNEFRGSGIEPYLELAQRYYSGGAVVLTDEQQRRAMLHGLMLADQEATVLELFPELRATFEQADTNQLTAVSSPQNLDYFLEQGVEVTLDTQTLDPLLETVDPSKPLSVSLMREQIVHVNGFRNVRINFLYHDIMDHMWAFSHLREVGIYDKYKDFLDSTGNPFAGFLFSKQSELVSGVGYNARRYLSQPEYFASMAINPDLVVEHFDTQKVQPSPNSEQAIAKLDDKELSDCVGFVIKGALASLLVQRARRGCVKRVELDSGSPVLSDEIISLLDPEYLAFIIDSVDSFMQNKGPYLEEQIRLNLAIENVLLRYVRLGETTGKLALQGRINESEIPKDSYKILTTTSGVSTSYYS